jgi:aspartate aminotransferase-like enzyme
MLPDYSVLRVPGPTPIPPSVMRAMSVPMVAHRNDEFVELIFDVAEGLKPVLGTKEDVFIITGSGTLAMEMTITNFLSEGDPVLVVITGFFGDRFAKICRSYLLDVHCIEKEWGEACSGEQVEAFLKQHPEIKAVFITHCETSTGVLNPIQEISEVIHRSSEALIIVDAVSSAATVDIQMDRWGIDVLVTGSQKGLMLPAGLAFIAVSQRAWQQKSQAHKAGFYMDLQAYQASLNKGYTPFTPAVSLVFGLQQVLELIAQEGLAEVYQRHQLMRDMTRAACKQWGLNLVAVDHAARLQLQRYL